MYADLVPVVSVVSGRPMVSSLRIAEHFDKRHCHILDCVQRVMADCPAEFREPNFRLTEVELPMPKGGGVRKSPAYDLTRDAFALVVMGFTGKLALAWKVKYIQAFNAMEAELMLRQAQPSPALPLDMAALPKDRYIELLEAENALLRRAPERARVTPEQSAAILRLHAAGLMPAEIGRRVGRKAETVSTVLRRARAQARA